MVKNSYVLLIAFALFAENITAQCTGNRYRDQIFSNTTKTTVTYSTVYNLAMDIYTPTGDNVTNRPAILLAHGGSFTGGNRNEPTIVELCKRFAKRGYVTASMSYRLATNPFDMTQPSTGYPVVVKAMSDAKAAIRYLKANATTYGIDSNLIIVGGNSAGAILMLHLAWVDDSTEAATEPIIINAVNNNGGIEGNSGNPGPTSKVVAIIDWAGGIKDTSWISPNDEPVVALHGDPDGTVPYNYGQVLGGFSQITLHGPGSYTKRANNVGLKYWHKRYPNGDHQPWGLSGSGAVFDEADSITMEFLYQEVICKTSAALHEPSSLYSINIHPNPASDVIHVSLSEYSPNTLVVLSDLQDREWMRYAAAPVVTISSSHLPAGVYLVKVLDQNRTVATMRVVVQ
ncbi:MAG: alpha/beta hydrolase fold domain-containing protein [Chitinophagales bacterium]|nr:alpha/beta hydrolase fold domain-containing protein [Chitinophagales bacterium]MDW8418500.1 alpha/beta hydrolase fold domain-containing protein [Chitinophagales bacterium]